MLTTCEKLIFSFLYVLTFTFFVLPGMRFICRAFLPSVSLETVSDLLGFGLSEVNVALCKEYLTVACCVVEEDEDDASTSGGGEKEATTSAAVVFKSNSNDTMIDTKLTLTKGYFTRPYMFKIMDGDSVTG